MEHVLKFWKVKSIFTKIEWKRPESWITTLKRRKERGKKSNDISRIIKSQNALCKFFLYQL